MLALAAPAAATSRIKDLANLKRGRPNRLIGYGLVVGLNGTGLARYDRNPAWTIKAAGAIQADIKPVADPKAKAPAQATDFEAVRADEVRCG
jgi:hypothetical protein